MPLLARLSTREGCGLGGRFAVVKDATRPRGAQNAKIKRGKAIALSTPTLMVAVRVLCQTGAWFTEKGNQEGI